MIIGDEQSRLRVTSGEVELYISRERDRCDLTTAWNAGALPEFVGEHALISQRWTPEAKLPLWIVYAINEKAFLVFDDSTLKFDVAEALPLVEVFAPPDADFETALRRLSLKAQSESLRQTFEAISGAREIRTGMDFEWCARDGKGQVAIFNWSMDQSIPQAVFDRGFNHHVELMRELHLLPSRVGESVVISGERAFTYGDEDECRKLGNQGLFLFEGVGDVYRARTRPATPLLATELSSRAQEHLRHLVVAESPFEEISTVEPSLA